MLTRYFPGDQIDDNEMGWTCGTYGEEDKCIAEFCSETSRNRPLGKLGGRKLEDNLEWILKE